MIQSDKHLGGFVTIKENILDFNLFQNKYLGLTKWDGWANKQGLTHLNSPEPSVVLCVHYQ